MMTTRTALILAGVLLGGLVAGRAEKAEPAAFKAEMFRNSQNEQLPYRLLYPANYDAAKKYPLVLFLHGAGAQGDDNDRQVAEVPAMLRRAAAGAEHACFVLAPQCPKEDAWARFPRYPLALTTPEPSRASRLSLEIIDSLLLKLSIDRQRIYVTGLSLGGEGTFDIITRRPGFFAAAVPVCGIADTTKAALMKHTPFWIFHGDSDDINPVEYSRAMVKALEQEGVKPRYTEYKGVKHDSWTKAYQEAELLDWMFRQRRQELRAES
jgi:predicted peptidase